MKEILVEAHGGPEQLKLHDSPSQAPGPNHVLVRISAAGVNFMDTGVRRGIFWADKTPPFVPGVEGAGRVMALGEAVDHLRGGDRVAWFYIHGSYAEELIAPADKLVPIPGWSGVQGSMHLIHH